jgi:hypothetical protein
VPSNAIYEFRSPAVQTAVASRDFFVSGSVVSICDSPEYDRTANDEVVNPDGLGCARGLRSAFILEIGMALAAYGIWHLFHLAH